MAVPDPSGPDTEHLLARLATAEAHIRADRLAEAATLYQELLSEPGLTALPKAQTEVLANYGALLLHQARLTPDTAGSEQALSLAIDLLSQARENYRQGHGAGSGVISCTNLALAFFQRHQLTARHADLMAAHMVLDGAEAMLKPEELDVKDWIRSIRDTLVEHADRRRNPR